jgi:hypothetical protein
MTESRTDGGDGAGGKQQQSPEVAAAADGAVKVSEEQSKDIERRLGRPFERAC